MGPYAPARRLTLATLTLVLAAATGCGVGEGAATSSSGFAIELSAPSATVQPGEAATAAIRLLRRGATGDITPSIEGLPAGVQATFSPGAFTGSADRLIVTFTAAPGASVGIHDLSVRAHADGASAEAKLTLIVHTSGGSSNYVALTFCPDELPAWLAYQNEGEQWVRVMPDAGGSFVFSGTNRVGLAWVQLTPDATRLSVVYTTVAELTPRNGLPCVPTTGGSNVTGTFSGLGSSVGVVSMAHAFDYNQSATTIPRFALTRLPERALDLVAMRADVNRAADAIPNRVLIRRRVNPLTTPTTSIDFANDEGLSPVSAPLLLDNLAGDTLVMHVSYRTANGTEGPIEHLTTVAAPTLYGVPPVLQAPSDVHVISLLALGGQSSNRGAYLYQHAITASRVMLGGMLADPAVSVADSTGYPHFRMSLPAQGDYAKAFVASYLQASRLTSVVVTSGYARGAAAWDVTIPELGGAADWSIDWAPAAGQATTWAATALSGTAPIFGGTPPSGTIELFATRWGTVGASSPAPSRSPLDARLRGTVVPFAPFQR